ncbi:hypothetical protein BV20DRAFT_143366 [Pilatotrama ljubarskyi]|nr:hypothetical protein BV20DRAFT_143366 [Pilatotrama ljubarskyi]
MRQEMSSERAADLIEIESSIASTLDDLTMATSTIAPALETLLIQSLERAYASLNVKLQDMNGLSERVGSRFIHLEHDVELLQQGLHALIGNAEEAGYALATALQDTNVAHGKQLHLAQVTDEIAMALNRLVDTTQLEMQSINKTAAAMKESLLQGSAGDWYTSTWSWLAAASNYCYKYIWNEDSSFLDIPALRVLCLLFRVLWWILGLASSGLTSALVLLASRRTWLVRNLAADPSNSLLAPFDVQSPGARYLGSVATIKSSGSDCAFPGPGALPADNNVDFTGAGIHHRRRPRISRIPDRLCKSVI